ncbi:hypothetical protein ACNOYE_37250 [Nannocystaceae bacterium ST9]
MTTTHERILARLRGPDDHVERLVSLTIEHLLERPLAELVDPSWLAHALSESLRASARSDEFERWVAQRLEQALGRADQLHGTLGDKLPITVLAPLQKALARPYQPDRELVEALLDHPSTRSILREVLQANVLEFAKRMRSMFPEGRPASGGGGLASKLAGMAKGVAAAVGSELEKQLEPKVEGFVDDILGVAVRMMIDRVGSEEFAPEFAKWRVDVLLALLDHPLDRLIAERHKYPSADFAADVAAILRALAAWRGLGERIEAVFGELIAEHGHRSAREFLDGSGLEQAWRPTLEQAVVEQARQWVDTEGFSEWLRVLVED